MSEEPINIKFSGTYDLGQAQPRRRGKTTSANINNSNNDILPITQSAPSPTPAHNPNSSSLTETELSALLAAEQCAAQNARLSIDNNPFTRKNNNASNNINSPQLDNFLGSLVNSSNSHEIIPSSPICTNPAAVNDLNTLLGLVASGLHAQTQPILNSPVNLTASLSATETEEEFNRQNAVLNKLNEDMNNIASAEEELDPPPPPPPNDPDDNDDDNQYEDNTDYDSEEDEKAAMQKTTKLEPIDTPNNIETSAEEPTAPPG